MDTGEAKPLEWTDVRLSVDLVESALRHLHFLDNVDNFDKILTGDVLEHALYRYEKQWLPLANANSVGDIEPPIDVGWLWYIHLLSPLAYRRDCRKMFKKTLDHGFKNEHSTIECKNNAIEIWYKTYPQDGFNIIRNDRYVKSSRSPTAVSLERSNLSVDLKQNAETHMHFCYQVALPHFRDKKYLENALKRYKQFLCLKRMEPDEFLTPSVDIMLLWFTHMCYPSAYANDLMRICGRVLDNNIKVKPAPLDASFRQAKEKTEVLWRQITCEPLVQPGTKLRSNEIKKEIFDMTFADLKNSCIVEYKLYFSHAEIEGLPTHMKKFNLHIVLLGHDNVTEELTIVKGKKRMWALSTKFVFNSVRHKKLEVHVTSRQKFWCYKGELPYADAAIDLRQNIESRGPTERGLALHADLTTIDGVPLQVMIDGGITCSEPKLCDLILKRKEYEQKSLSAYEMHKTWGNAILEQDETTQQLNYDCYFCTHWLLNHEDKKCFRCRVVHVPELLRSGVEVHYQNKLVATSYAIGSSQLPSPSQVHWSDHSMAFDPELGERAMLIRNSKGDWGLCVARWTEEKGDSFMEVRFLKLVGQNKLQRLEIRSTDMIFQSFNANVYRGIVQINPSNNTVGENLATMWSICILYVLCAPRSPHRQIQLSTVEQQEPKSTNGNETDKPVRPKLAPESECQFLLAAGLTTKVPSNEYILKTHGSLTYDLSLEAQNILVEEHKTDKKLFHKESKILKGDRMEDIVKKLKKKKSKLKESVMKVNAETKENVKAVLTQPPPAQPPPVVKVKKIKKKRSSTMDELAPSDDSLDREENEFKQFADGLTKSQIVEVVKREKNIHRKRSSRLDEILSPSDDSVDKDEQEEKEFIGGDQGSTVQLNNEMNKPSSDTLPVANGTLNIPHDELTISREETSLIRNKAANKKTPRNEPDIAPEELTISREQTSLIRNIAANKARENNDSGVSPDELTISREQTSIIRNIAANKARGNNDLSNSPEELTISREQTEIIRNIAANKARERHDSDNKSVVASEIGTYASKDKSPVKFDQGGSEQSQNTSFDDTRSDTSSINESKKMRHKRISKTREEMYPITDEDKSVPGESVTPSRKRKSKRKRSNSSELTGIVEISRAGAPETLTNV